jgi:hypothetical protein
MNKPLNKLESEPGTLFVGKCDLHEACDETYYPLLAALVMTLFHDTPLQAQSILDVAHSTLHALDEILKARPDIPDWFRKERAETGSLMVTLATFCLNNEFARLERRANEIQRAGATYGLRSVQGDDHA